ncbi:MAG: hypothetical protein AAFO82_16160, partial [Bacteroidota bacterium]
DYLPVVWTSSYAFSTFDFSLPPEVPFAAPAEKYSGFQRLRDIILEFINHHFSPLKTLSETILGYVF